VLLDPEELGPDEEDPPDGDELDDEPDEPPDSADLAAGADLSAPVAEPDPPDPAAEVFCASRLSLR